MAAMLAVAVDQHKKLSQTVAGNLRFNYDADDDVASLSSFSLLNNYTILQYSITINICLEFLVFLLYFLLTICRATVFWYDCIVFY